MSLSIRRTAGPNGALQPLLLALLLMALWQSPALAWWNDQWSMRKKITIDASAAGANVTDPIGGVPLLVRLHVSNFRFGAAKADGSDLRFVAGDDKSPLKHHIEKYDPLLGEALVWVRVPDIKPGVKTEVWLYFGSDKAQAANDPRGTYDGDTLLVYHFNDRGGPAQDATAWANHARNGLSAADGSIIGQGVRLDGQSTLVVPSSSSLVSADGGEATVSFWFKMAAPQPGAVLFTRSEGASGFTLGLDSGGPYVEITRDGTPQRAAGNGAVGAGSWHHMALVASGSQTTVYLDGSPAASLAVGLPTLTGGAQVGGPMAGAGQAQPGTAAPAAGTAPAEPAAAQPANPAPADAAAATPPANASVFASSTAGVAFSGELDEFSLAKVARPTGFIRFAVINQGPDHGKLVSYSVDEETVGWFNSGYFGVILRSVTVDGWVVIGILGVMAVISWFVMIGRARYLGRAGKCNTLFQKVFKETDVAALFEADVFDNAPKKRRKTLMASPLYRLFSAGRAEVLRRRSAANGRPGLTPQAMASIRAVVDSVFVREVQRLNRQMVILTIAISGGPFLGLLGTVVGVMITFAAIAQTGDVNINAIAPGIAAALVATVAGLAVAIPALFAYNYFTIRIKDITSELQVFIDELIALIGEASDDRSLQQTRAAAE